MKTIKILHSRKYIINTVIEIFVEVFRMVDFLLKNLREIVCPAKVFVMFQNTFPICQVYVG